MHAQPAQEIRREAELAARLLDHRPGGGLQLPASWVVQYWNGSQFVDVPNASGYPEADNVFNQVTFGSVTTTRLRVVMVAAPTAGGVGAIQWVVPSIPGSGPG